MSKRIMVSWAFLGFVCCGCGGGEVRFPTVPVKGHLFIDGKSYGPALLNLSITPPDPNSRAPVVNAYVKADGSFVMKTYVEGDGAPAGNYDVRLAMDPMAMGMMPQVKPLTVEIAKPATGELELDIKLESTGTGQMVSPLPPPPGQGPAAK